MTEPTEADFPTQAEAKRTTHMIEQRVGRKVRHQHEAWQIRESDSGGYYCAACGEDVPKEQLPRGYVINHTHPQPEGYDEGTGEFVAEGTFPEAEGHEIDYTLNEYGHWVTTRKPKQTAEDFDPEHYVYGAEARGAALAAGDPDWVQVTRYPRGEITDHLAEIEKQQALKDRMRSEIRAAIVEALGQVYYADAPIKKALSIEVEQSGAVLVTWSAGEAVERFVVQVMNP